MSCGTNVSSIIDQALLAHLEYTAPSCPVLAPGAELLKIIELCLIAYVS